MNHWMDWYNSNHPTRQGLDINSKAFQIPHFDAKVHEWDQAMIQAAQEAKAKEQADAQVLHQWPDGWKLQRLMAEHLGYEGEVMGHCVGGYGYEDKVRRGDTAILSLRDPQGRPHVTTELDLDRDPGDGGHDIDFDNLNENPYTTELLTPADRERLKQLHTQLQHKTDGTIEHLENLARYGGEEYGMDNTGLASPKDYRDYLQFRRYHGVLNPPLENARIVQIQGKGNEVPKPEYQQRMKDWFSTFHPSEVPDWDHDNDINDIAHLDPNVEPDNAEDYYGGYGPHGDYGLPDNRETNYEGLLGTAATAQRGGGRHGDDYIYDKDHGRLIYEHARQRGEIPKLGEQLENWQNWVNDDYNKLEEHNLDYLDYPGEEMEDDPERWKDVAHHEGFESPEEAFNDAREKYDWNQQELYESHAPSQVLDHMYALMRPHQNSGGVSGYRQEPYTPEEQGYHANDQQVTLNQLPAGTAYTGDGGGRYYIPHGAYPSYPSGWGNTVPSYIKPPHVAHVARGPVGVHPHYSTGKPCSCPWGRPPTMAKTAAKLDWLRGRQDLQTPEAQRLLRHYDDLVARHGDKVDPLLPWVTREWKKGRLIHHYVPEFAEGNPDYTGMIAHPTEEGVQYDPGRWRQQRDQFTRADLGHWADWYNSDSPTRQGLDIGSKQFQVPHMLDRIQQWDAEMEAKRLEQEQEEEQSRGKIVHRFDDGWTVRQLRDAEEARDEGDAMGHCVGSYGRQIENGDSAIFSLRDHKNQPHATMEIKGHDLNHTVIPDHVWDEVPSHGDLPAARLQELYDNWAGQHIAVGLDPTHPNTREQKTYNDFLDTYGFPDISTGKIVQTQGKSNASPLPEYTDRLAQFYEPHGLERFKPWWDERWGVPMNEIDNVDDYLGVHGNHPDPKFEPDWEGLEYENDERREAEDALYQAYGEDGLHESVPTHVDEIKWGDLLNSLMIDPGNRYMYNRPEQQRAYDPAMGQALVDTATEHQEQPTLYNADPNAEPVPDPDAPRGTYGHLDALREAFKDKYEEVAPYIPPFKPDLWLKAIPDPYERRDALEQAEQAHYDHHWESVDPEQAKMFSHLGAMLFPGWNQSITKPQVTHQVIRPEVPPGQEPLFQTPHPQQPQTPDSVAYPQWSDPAWYTEGGSREPYGTTYAKTAGAPLYYRWVFSPKSGQVDLAHNGEPVVRYHGDLASARNEPGLVHGYAYRIGGGWRLFDWEHKPLGDPFVVAQVMRKLRGEEAYDPAAQSEWEPVQDDFGRQHNGIPLPAE
jgi:hypothetical protein